MLFEVDTKNGTISIEVFTPPKGTYSKRQQEFIKKIPGLIEPEEGKNTMQNWFKMSLSLQCSRPDRNRCK